MAPDWKRVLALGIPGLMREAAGDATVHKAARICLEALRGTPLRCSKPEATYMLWTDCSALRMDTAALSAFMMEKAHIIPELGSVFFTPDYATYTGPQSHMRLNIGMPPSVVRSAMDNLRKALLSLEA